MLVNATAGHFMFSFVDGLNGYNQTKMDSSDAKLSDFRTSMGKFHYTVMPSGLKNGGVTCQCAVTAIFQNMLHYRLKDYADDVVVKPKEKHHHTEDLREVFAKCKRYKLLMNPQKCASLFHFFFSHLFF